VLTQNTTLRAQIFLHQLADQSEKELFNSLSYIDVYFFRFLTDN